MQQIFYWLVGLLQMVVVSAIRWFLWRLRLQKINFTILSCCYKQKIVTVTIRCHEYTASFHIYVFNVYCMFNAFRLHSGGRGRERDKKARRPSILCLHSGCIILHHFVMLSVHAVCSTLRMLYTFYADSSNKMSFYFNYAFKNLVFMLEFLFPQLRLLCMPCLRFVCFSLKFMYSTEMQRHCKYNFNVCSTSEISTK